LSFNATYIYHYEVTRGPIEGRGFSNTRGPKDHVIEAAAIIIDNKRLQRKSCVADILERQASSAIAIKFSRFESHRRPNFFQTICYGRLGSG